jgi:hypothetical protein
MNNRHNFILLLAQIWYLSTFSRESEQVEYVCLHICVNNFFLKWPSHKFPSLLQLHSCRYSLATTLLFMGIRHYFCLSLIGRSNSMPPCGTVKYTNHIPSPCENQEALQSLRTKKPASHRVVVHTVPCMTQNGTLFPRLGCEYI